MMRLRVYLIPLNPAVDGSLFRDIYEMLSWCTHNFNFLMYKYLFSVPANMFFCLSFDFNLVFLMKSYHCMFQLAFNNFSLYNVSKTTNWIVHHVTECRWCWGKGFGMVRKRDSPSDQSLNESYFISNVSLLTDILFICCRSVE